MEADPSLLSLNVALGVLLVDILLSGDNAIVIALVCRSLPQAQRSRALWLGVIGALIARLVLTSCATLVMHLPLLKLVGGLLLLKISVELIVDNTGAGHHPDGPQHDGATDMFAAARTIILADVVMSLDNVLALSAVTQNNWSMLLAGLALSIPILMFGSVYVGRLLDAFPHFLWLGGAILGAVSGALIVEDPIFDGAFNAATSIANLVVPLVSAIFVIQISRVIVRTAPSMRRLPRPPSLFEIVRGNGPTTLPSAVVQKLATGEPAADIRLPVRTPEPSLPAPPAPAPKVRVAPAHKVVEHQIIIALGLFMVATGGLLYYLLNVYQPAVPNQFVTYLCKQPAMRISYMPHAKEIRFATANGVVKTDVIDDRIVWEDYREAGTRLSVPPPVKIIAVDARQLVVHGGMFDNVTCYPVAP